MNQKVRLVDTVSTSATRTAADYPWADGMVAVIKKTLPSIKLHDLYDNDGYELVGPNENDGQKLAVKIANALKAAGFEVKHGFDEFTNEIYAVNAKGDKNHLVISETAESFVDGSWIIQLIGTSKIEWSSHSSSVEASGATPWVKNFAEPILESFPKFKIAKLATGGEVNLEGDNVKDGTERTHLMIEEFADTGYFVTEGKLEGDQVYIIREEGGQNQLLIRASLHGFKNGTFTIQAVGPQKIDATNLHSISSSQPTGGLHDFVSESAKAPTKAQLAKAKKVLTSAKNSARAQKRAAVKEKFDAFQKKRAEMDAEVQTAKDSMDHASQALADYDEHVRKERRSLEALENKATDAYDKAKAKRNKALLPLATKLSTADGAYAEETGKSALSPKAKVYVGRLVSDAAKKAKPFGKGRASGPDIPPPKRKAIPIPNALKGEERKSFINKMRQKGYTAKDGAGRLIKPRAK